MKRKSKLLAAAIAMLALSTAASVTGTVAWFTAANTVSVSSMTIQADVEEGIVIANETHAADSDWGTSVEASHQNTGAASKLLPVSTSDLSNWYHGLSDKADNGQSNVRYEKFGAASDANSDGIYEGSTQTQVTNGKMYLLNKFYLQASAQSDIATQDIFMKNLTVARTDNTDKLSPSLRVGVSYKLPGGSETFAKIFVPVTTGTPNNLSYSTIATLTEDDPSTSADEQVYTLAAIGTKAVAGGTGIDVELIDNTTIKAYTTAGTNAIEFGIYIWFEGEDPNHKSANVGALDQLTVSFALENKLHA